MAIPISTKNSTLLDEILEHLDTLSPDEIEFLARYVKNRLAEIEDAKRILAYADELYQHERRVPLDNATEPMNVEKLEATFAQIRAGLTDGERETIIAHMRGGQRNDMAWLEVEDEADV